MRYIIGLPIALVSTALVISVILNIVLAGLLSLTYTNLTKEQIVASITFEVINNKKNQYKATLLDYEGSKIGDYVIFGDQWRIDASFIKMEYMANILGVDSKYTLDRFEGRYKDILEQNTQIKKSYQIEGKSIAETFSWFIDTQYGTSTYNDIKLNTLYTVLKSPTGLLVREKSIKGVEEKGYFDTAKSLIGLD